MWDGGALGIWESDVTNLQLGYCERVEGIWGKCNLVVGVWGEIERWVLQWRFGEENQKVFPWLGWATSKEWYGLNELLRDFEKKYQLPLAKRRLLDTRKADHPFSSSFSSNHFQLLSFISSNLFQKYLMNFHPFLSKPFISFKKNHPLFLKFFLI